MQEEPDINAEVMQALRTMASGLESSLTASREIAVLIAHNRIMEAIKRWALWNSEPNPHLCTECGNSEEEGLINNRCTDCVLKYSW